MVEEIEVFGQILEFDEALIRDTKLHIFTQDMATQAAEKTNEFIREHRIYIFENAEIAEKNIRILCIDARGKVLEYCMKKLGVLTFNGNESLLKPNEKFLVTRRFIDTMALYIEAKMSGEEEKWFEKSCEEFIIKCQRAIFMDVYNILEPLENVLQKKGVNITKVTVADEENAVRLFEQLQKTRDKNRAYKLAYEMFKNDPTEREYYEYCMTNYPEELAALFSMYKVVGFEVKQDYVESMFRNYYKKMPHKTEPELLQIKNQFDVIQNVIGVFDTDIHKKVEKTLEKIDLKARTFRRTVYDTREQKENAEKEYNENIQKEKLEKARMKREKREQKEKELELKKEIESRTLYGTVYESIEELEMAKNEHKKVDYLKEQLLTTKSQKKRYEIFVSYNMETENPDVQRRYEQLKEKVSMPIPLSEKINVIYGVSVIVAFILAIIFEALEVNEVLFMVPMLWAGFGVWIWGIWKGIWFIKSKKKSYYKNIKYI